MSYRDTPDLVVETGLHRSAHCSIPSGRNGVGAKSDDAIVISDLKDSFVLDRRPNGLFLCAIAAPIQLQHAKSLKPGRERRCVDAMRFDCGGVAFRLEVPAAPAQKPWPRSFGRILAYTGGVLAVATVSAVVLSGAASYPERAERTLASLTSGAAVEPLSPASSSVLAPEPTKAKSIEADLRRHLDSVGLQSVAITKQGEGAIEATGEIAPGDEMNWRKIGQWFDAHAKGRMVLVDAVRVVTITPPLAIRAVWSGRNPYVVDGDGDRLFVGSVLDTGWTIDAIHADRVMVRRGDRSVAVRF